MDATEPRKPRPLSRGEFYRWCRLIHGWLSAAAFLLLVFFSGTGLLLNHPDWLQVTASPPVESRVQLSAEERAQVRADREPARRMTQIVGRKAALVGAFSDGDVSGDDVFARLQGARGGSDVRGSLVTGAVQVVVEHANAVSVLNNLHRAERAGPAWRLLVDVTAIVLIVLSVVGYVIFLSLRFRLRTALILTAASLGLIGLLFALTVP